MTLPFDAQLRQARLAHLGYWLCFGAAAGGVLSIWFAAPTLLAVVVGTILFGLLVGICLRGIYYSWDAMTAYEQ